jgi:hypothetical protein
VSLRHFIPFHTIPNLSLPVTSSCWPRVPVWEKYTSQLRSGSLHLEHCWVLRIVSIYSLFNPLVGLRVYVVYVSWSVFVSFFSYPWVFGLLPVSACLMPERQASLRDPLGFHLSLHHKRFWFTYHTHDTTHTHDTRKWYVCPCFHMFLVEQWNASPWVSASRWNVEHQARLAGFPFLFIRLVSGFFGLFIFYLHRKRDVVSVFFLQRVWRGPHFGEYVPHAF